MKTSVSFAILGILVASIITKAAVSAALAEREPVGWKKFYIA
jgi:hypothetical protein